MGPHLTEAGCVGLTVSGTAKETGERDKVEQHEKDTDDEAQDEVGHAALVAEPTAEEGSRFTRPRFRPQQRLSLHV